MKKQNHESSVMRPSCNKLSFQVYALLAYLLLFSHGILRADNAPVEGTMPSQASVQEESSTPRVNIPEPEDEYIKGLKRYVSVAPALPLDVVLETTQEEFKNWDIRYDLTFYIYLRYSDFAYFIKRVKPSSIIKSFEKYPTLSAKEKAFFLTALYLRLNEERHILNGTRSYNSMTYMSSALPSEEEREAMYDFLRQHVNDQTVALAPLTEDDAEELWERWKSDLHPFFLRQPLEEAFPEDTAEGRWKIDLRDACRLLQRYLDFACHDADMPLIAYQQIMDNLDSLPDIVIYTLMRTQINLLRKSLERYYPQPSHIMYGNHLDIGYARSAGPPAPEEYYSVVRVFDEYLDLQYIAARNGVTEGVVNDVSCQEETTIGQIAQRLLDALETPALLQTSMSSAFTLSAQDVANESLATLISSISDDVVFPLDLIQPIAKKNDPYRPHIGRYPAASSKPISLSPRYDYNYKEFAAFYQFFEKALMASKGEVLECVARADKFTVRQRAYILAALYLRQQSLPTAGGLYYKGRLGSYFLKGAMLEEFTTEESKLIEEFVTKCETNVEELFPSEQLLHTPMKWEDTFRRDALRLQSVVLADPDLPKAYTTYWMKFYAEASLGDIYYVLTFETDLATQRLLKTLSSAERETLYKPFPADEVLVTPEEAQTHENDVTLSDAERYLETRRLRAFLLSEPVISGFRSLDEVEPQLTSVRTLRDMTTVLPIVPAVCE